MQAIARLIGLGFIGLCLITVTLKAFLPLGVLGYAPLAIPLGPSGQPIEIVVWYGTEKRAWLEEAVARFEASGSNINGRPIQVRLVGMGSREIADRIARQEWGNEGIPTVASPASSLWIELLRSDWSARNGADIVVGDTTALVLTPIVAVAWEERANVLWPQGVAHFWPDLHAALSDSGGWPSVAERNGFGTTTPQGQAAQNWGLVKFGHTSPLTSNSGAQSLILMAYAYHNKSSQLSPADVLDEDFQRWLEEMEAAVLDFGDSTGTFMTNMVQFGPSKYDVVMVYENLAIENVEAAQGRWGQPLRVYYPPATTFSDHPFAVLGDPLTTPAQREAAAVFGEFLISRPIQDLALQFGFRPADPNVSIVTNDANNPFNRFASYGIQVDIGQQVQTPSGETISTLLDLWRRRIGPYALRFDGNNP
ncbi:MAG: ABC transporter substrate-binding protein [Oscillochloris sp.]|nr:ABC transporter substrate-binding protein [Oscillochloris sp.]